MATCDQCGKHENMPYNCNQCGGVYCGDHRLPENHDCPGLAQWNDPDGVFDSGFDDSVRNEGGRSDSIVDRLGVDTGPGGLFGYFRGNMTYVFLALMWGTFMLQWSLAWVLDPFGSLQMTGDSYRLWEAIFVISPQNPLYVWTWVTSIFAHGGFYHIVGNSIVIYFFGRLVEEYLGFRDYTLFFVGSGVVAGLGQMGLGLLQGSTTGALGASGAGLAIMGFLTVLNPNLRVYLYFVLPIPIWLLTGGYAVFSIVGIGGGVAGGVGHVAHLLGLVIGAVYAQHLKRQGLRRPKQLQFGGGGPGGGMGGGRRRGPGGRF